MAVDMILELEDITGESKVEDFVRSDRHLFVLLGSLQQRQRAYGRRRFGRRQGEYS